MDTTHRQAQPSATRQPMEKCQGCPKLLPLYMFYSEDQKKRTRCLKCRIKATMNTAWNTWGKGTGYHRQSEPTLRAGMIQSQLDTLARWKAATARHHPNVVVLDDQEEEEIRSMIDKTAPTSSQLATWLETTSSEPKPQPPGRRCQWCTLQRKDCDRRRPCNVCRAAKRDAKKCCDCPKDLPQPFTDTEMWKSPGKYSGIRVLQSLNSHNQCKNCQAMYFPNYVFFNPGYKSERDYRTPFVDCLYCRAEGEICHFFHKTYDIALHQADINSGSGKQPKDLAWLRVRLQERFERWFEQWKTAMDEHAGYVAPNEVEAEYIEWWQEWVEKILDPSRYVTLVNPEPDHGTSPQDFGRDENSPDPSDNVSQTEESESDSDESLHNTRAARKRRLKDNSRTVNKSRRMSSPELSMSHTTLERRSTRATSVSHEIQSLGGRVPASLSASPESQQHPKHSQVNRFYKARPVIGQHAHAHYEPSPNGDKDRLTDMLDLMQNLETLLERMRSKLGDEEVNEILNLQCLAFDENVDLIFSSMGLLASTLQKVFHFSSDILPRNQESSSRVIQILDRMKELRKVLDTSCNQGGCEDINRLLSINWRGFKENSDKMLISARNLLRGLEDSEE